MASAIYFCVYFGAENFIDRSSWVGVSEKMSHSIKKKKKKNSFNVLFFESPRPV